MNENRQLASDWDSLAHHRAVANGPNYGDVIAALMPAIGAELKMHLVIFNDHPIAFEYPVTEVNVITLKDPSYRTEVYEILTTVSEKTEKKLVFGPTLEDENVIVVVGGWESIEVGTPTIIDSDALMLLTAIRLTRSLPLYPRPRP